MTPGEIVLLVDLVVDLTSRLTKAAGLLKRGTVTPEELDAIVAEDDKARADLVAAIAAARAREAAQPGG